MRHAWRVDVLMRGGATRASSVLARRGSEVAIFDTGLAQHTAAFVAALAEEGLSVNDVTLVFNTHAHVDHSHNNALFPGARIFFSARDRQWTHDFHQALASAEYPDAETIAAFYPELAGSGVSPKVTRKIAGIEKLLWDPARWGRGDQAAHLESTPLPPGIALIETPGHSPWHASFAITTLDRAVLVCGDALVLRDEDAYAAPMMPPWSTGRYAESRAIIRAFDGLIVPGHDEPFENHP
ncbi:MAG TPA: MBL fold metallo-hydrolase [Vicinamibacterales bacterium]|jgi:N-acyl homoserine lactone hydrolase|nr:MBL fold metallo-hydrolase [Vicinamibacterales bacterium]